MNIIDSLIQQRFELIVSFKAICEFVAKERFEGRNAYKLFIDYFLPKLTGDGILLLADVTTYSTALNEWLPRLMDKALASSACIVNSRNEGYSQLFKVSHSKSHIDESKLAWRIIQKVNTL